jgi:hypothetical protein
MPYIGKGPIDRTLGLNEKNVFTGDGSLVAFDISSEALGENALQVFVDNVRQEPGTGKAFTLGLDGSSVNKRITFSAAPANLAEIYVLNSLRTQIVSTAADNSITAAKIATNAVTTTKIAAGAVGTTDIADNAVTGAKIAMGSDAAGDLLTYTGTDYVRLAKGTAAQALVMNSGATAVEWGAGATINNNANNRVITGSATTGTLEGEANLTYDGTTVDVKNAGTASDVKLYCESSNAHYTSIKSAAHSAYTGGSWTLTLPGTDGTSGEFLTTNGSGVSSWAAVPAGAPTGGGSEKVFYENENQVDTNYTLTTNYNAVSAGPVTVASGITVTIPAGQAWVIV